MSIDGLRLVVYDDLSTSSQKTDSLREVYSKLAWKPVISHMTNDEARLMFPSRRDIQQIERKRRLLSQLCDNVFLDISANHAKLVSANSQDYLGKFCAWVTRSVDGIKARIPVNDTHQNVTDRSKEIKGLRLEPDDVIEAQLITQVYRKLPEILRGETSRLIVVLQGNLLLEMYVSGIGISAGYE